MSHQYQQLIRDVMEQGVNLPDRTGVGRRSISGARYVHHMQYGFPAHTLRKAPVLSAIAEMATMMRGLSSAADFREAGCKFWDANANKNADWLANPFRKGEDDNGKIYGRTWRNWDAYKVIQRGEKACGLKALNAACANGFKNIGQYEGKDRDIYFVMHKPIDQLVKCIRDIIVNPTSRRILFHGWDWATLDEMSLPPCGLKYQFIVLNDKLDLVVDQRSADLLLGVPSNIAGSAYMLSVVAAMTGKTPGKLTLNFGDCHIYLNHFEAAMQLLERSTFVPPQLHLDVPCVATVTTVDLYELDEVIAEVLDYLNPKACSLENYVCGPAIDPALLPMAV